MRESDFLSVDDFEETEEVSIKQKQIINSKESEDKHKTIEMLPYYLLKYNLIKIVIITLL